jgi:hypothetical protein
MSPGRIRQNNIYNRYLELIWLADKDPIKEKELERTPLLTYFFKLTKKKEEAEKAIAEAKKLKSKK